MTSRRVWLLGSILSAACGPPREPDPPRVPKQVAGWTLRSDAQRITELIPNAKVAWRYMFSGRPEVALTMYAMPSETNGFDALQRWRPEAGKLAFYKGRYFGIAESAGADFRTLNAFISELRRTLPQA